MCALNQALRSSGISGSEIAAVVGLSNYATKIDVYRRKIGEMPEREQTEHMMRGTHLGPALVTWYEEKTGKVVSHHGAHEETLVSRRNPLVIATPDGLIHRSTRASVVEAVLECKAPSFRTAYQWGDEGTDEIPDVYVPQVIWEMAAADVQSADIAALIDGDLRIYHLAWDEELFQVLLEAAQHFWVDHVEKRIPPPPDGSNSYSNYLKERFPRNEGRMVAIDDKQREIVEEYRRASEILKTHEARFETLKQEIQQLIGNADGLEFDGGKITWKVCKGRSSTNWKAIAEKLGANEDLIREFTTQGAGYRRFLATFK